MDGGGCIGDGYGFFLGGGGGRVCGFSRVSGRWRLDCGECVWCVLRGMVGGRFGFVREGWREDVDEVIG